MAVFLLLAIESWSPPRTSLGLRSLTCLLLGIAMASRPNFLFLTPLLGAVWCRRVGFPQAAAGVTLVVGVAVAVTLPFYLHDPQGFTPLLAKQKLAVIDHSLPWASKAMIGLTGLTGILGGLAVLVRSPSGLVQAFFRWCTWVTLCPMLCAVIASSIIHQQLDFSFNRDRYGLMYVFFALLGWGGALRSPLPRPDEKSPTLPKLGQVSL